MAIAVSGDMTESIGAATIGMSKVTASIFHERSTSESLRVRRVGAMATSSKLYACVARLLRSSSYMMLLATRVVRRVRDVVDVVRVGFLQPGRGDAHELAPALELRHRAATDVEHTLMQPAHELMDDR